MKHGTEIRSNESNNKFELHKTMVDNQIKIVGNPNGRNGTL